MQLSPLQSRLVASLAASLAVLVLYWLLLSPSFAQAAELPSRSDAELDFDLVRQDLEQTDDLPSSYEPDIGPFGHSIIGRQAPPEAVPINLETPIPKNVEPRGAACFVLSPSSLADSGDSKRRRDHDILDPETSGNSSDSERVRRQDGGGTTVYISSTTCLRPSYTNNDGENRQPPQLRMLAATSSDAGCPMSTEELDDDMWVSFDEGLAMLSVDVSDAPLYITVIAPDEQGDFSGVYNVEMAVSTSNYYYYYDEASSTDKAVLWMDSDSSAALLVSQNLTHNRDDIQKIMRRDPPFELYVENTASSSLAGIRRSLCGMEKSALISARNDTGTAQSNLVRTSMTTRGPGALPKQQFYFEGLNRTSTYNAVLVQVSDYDDTGRFDSRQEAGSTRRFTAFSPIQFQTLAGEPPLVSRRREKPRLNTLLYLY